MPAPLDPSDASAGLDAQIAAEAARTQPAPVTTDGRVHPRDPLHGVKLETIVRTIFDRHGWAEMADRIPVRCFQFNPSVKSSLTFLRKTPWARQRLESWYIAEL